MKFKNSIYSILALPLITVGLSQSAFSQAIPEEGSHVRIMRNSDGSSTGLLIAENMYDARIIRKNDPTDPTKETPVRALRYSYNAQGQRSKPIVYVGVQGRTAQELKQWLDKS